MAEVNPQPKYEANKTYVVKGDLLNKLLAASLPVLAGEGLKEFATPKGKIISLDSPDRDIPFDVKLVRKSTGDFVTVTEGLLAEIDYTKDADEESIFYHKANNHRDSNGVLVEFEINSGEAIFLPVYETEYGQVDVADPLALVVLPKDTISKIYIPGVQSGITYYKLAEVITVAGQLKLAPFLAGSHITRRSGLTCDSVLKECDYVPPGETEPVTGNQLMRLSFVSGTLVRLGSTIAERAYAPTVDINSIDATRCT